MRIFRSDTLQDELEGNHFAISQGKLAMFLNMIIGICALMFVGVTALHGIMLPELAAGLGIGIYGLVVSFVLNSATSNAESNLNSSRRHSL